MNRLLSIALLSCCCLPLAAQRYDPATVPGPKKGLDADSWADGLADQPADHPDADVLPALAEAPADEPADQQDPDAQQAADKLHAELRVQQSDHLYAKLDTDSTRGVFAILIGSFDSKMIQLPGLPPLLATKMVVATGLAKTGGLVFDLGPGADRVDVFLQGIALSGDDVAATDVKFVPGKYEPATT